jgi:hypothetical protein
MLSDPYGKKAGETVVAKRMDLKEAAQVLGITSDSVRKRVKRGTLPSETGEDGRLYVWLDMGPDDGLDNALPGVSPDRSDALVEAKDETIRVLEAQLQAEREASAELRRIVAGLVQRTPELELAREPAPESPESPQTASEHGSGTQAPPQEEKRSWWQR